jgi:hypothetical protein
MPRPLVAGGEHGIGAVDLVTGGTEVVADGAEAGAAGDAVLHEPAMAGADGSCSTNWPPSS